MRLNSFHVTTKRETFRTRVKMGSVEFDAYDGTAPFKKRHSHRLKDFSAAVKATAVA